MKDQVYLAGISMTRFGIFPERSVKDMVREAVEGALTDAGAEQKDIDAAFFSNTAWGLPEGQVAVAGQVALRSMGFQRIPVVNVENAGAGGATAVHMAISYVRAGMADIALAVGVEKMRHPHMTTVSRLGEGGHDVRDPDGMRRILQEFGGPNGAAGGGGSGSWIEAHAGLTKAHMRDFGSTIRQLAFISSKNHRHSTLNPFAHCRREFSVDEVLAATPVCFPLTAPMCAPMIDGGAAAVICSARGLRRIRASRALKVLASVIGIGADRAPAAWDQSATAMAALRAYEESGIGPSDISVAEVHDASAFGELLQSEALGFCEFGAGGAFAESGATSLGGSIPVNPSGGLESMGHPAGATGIAQLFELALQLRGEAGPRQVADARFGIAQNGGGLYGSEDEAVAVITMLGQ